tara:strand:- start:53596 stop:54033 length:438 start_codon:yes stop_codon:yes gene_type:complete
MRNLLISLVLMLSASSIVAAPISVDVFTLSQWPIRQSAVYHALPDTATVTIYQLDSLTVLHHALNDYVKSHYMTLSKEAVAQSAKQWLVQHQSQYQHAAVGLANAQRYHITQLPAMVFNQQALVVGTTDISAAYSAYLDHQRAST